MGERRASRRRSKQFFVPLARIIRAGGEGRGEEQVRNRAASGDCWTSDGRRMSTPATSTVWRDTSPNERGYLSAEEAYPRVSYLNVLVVF